MKRSKYRNAMYYLFQKYVASDEWKKCRDMVRENAKGVCKKCGEFIGDAGVAHHRSYDHWGKGNFEEANSCLYLCKKCHGTIPHDNVPFFAKRSYDPVHLELSDIEDLREVLNHLYDK